MGVRFLEHPCSRLPLPGPHAESPSGITEPPPWGLWHFRVSHPGETDYRELYGCLLAVSKQKAAETGLRQCLEVSKD